MTLADSIETLDERFEDRTLTNLAVSVSFDTGGDVEAVETADDAVDREEVQAMVDEAVDEAVDGVIDETFDGIIEALEAEVEEPAELPEPDEEATVEASDGGEPSGVEIEEETDEEDERQKIGRYDGPTVSEVNDDDHQIVVKYPEADRRPGSVSVDRAYPVLKALFEAASPSDPVPSRTIDGIMSFNASPTLSLLFKGGMVERRKAKMSYTNRRVYGYWITAEGVQWLEEAEERFDDLPSVAEVPET